MTIFVNDTFTDANDVLLDAHTGEAGATWTRGSNSTDTSKPKIASNRIRGGAVEFVNAYYFASGTPASPDYWVQCDITLPIGPSQVDAVGGRMSSPTGDGYFAALYSAAGHVSLFKMIGGGTATEIAFVTPTFSAATHRVRLTMTGTTIAVRVFRVNDSQYLNSSGVWQSGAADCISVTDSAHTAAGKAGLWITPTTANFSLYDNFLADDGVVVGGGGPLTRSALLNSPLLNSRCIR